MIFGLFGGKKKQSEKLVDAARAGDVEAISRLLSEGADINAQESESGDTPLLAAIDTSQWAAAECLLLNQPDLHLEDKNGNSALYLAVSRGDSALKIVNLLLKAGAQVDLGPKSGDNAGATPLHITCATGANGCLERLLIHGASATKQLPSGASPLHTAAIGGDQKTIELLCKAGGNVTATAKDKRTPLHNCGVTGNAKAAAALIERGAVVDALDADGCTPLMHAVLNNRVEVARLLLDHGTDPDIVARSGSTPLYPLLVAAMNGYDEIVRLLLKKGANLTANVEGVPPPADAARHNGHKVAAKLISEAIKKANTAEKSVAMAAKDAESIWQRIVHAIARKDIEGLRTLTKGKAFASLSVDARLLASCALGDAKLVQDLLKAGANPNKPCEDGLDGVTPLVMTVGVSRSLEVASLLLDSGADVNDEWSDDTTPIFETTTDEYYDLAKLLVSRGADVNWRMSNGLTPLMFAARNGATRCVDLFLDAGADINAVEEEQDVGAFGLALNRLDLKLAEHLLGRGAEPNFGTIETLPLAVAEHGSLAFVNALEARGCTLVRDDQRGRMAFVSARNQDPEVFDYLLNHGADPTEGNNFGYTPLILAALNNHDLLIRRYLARGDDATVRDIDGETALSLAIEKRHEASVAALRAYHVEEGDYSALDAEAAMLKAAEDGALGSILNLRDSGIPLNCCDDQGNSTLMIAVRAGHHGVVRSLYHLGANINHRNHADESALSIARASDTSEMVNTLQEFGALDAAPGALTNLSEFFGGIPIYNLADTTFGRMSHPYKQTPPYDSESSDDDENSDASEEEQDDPDSDELDEVRLNDSGAVESIDSKLNLINQVLESDAFKEQVPQELREQLAQQLDNWRSLHEESVLGEDDLAELNRLVSLLGQGEVNEEGEEGAEDEVERTPLLEAIHAQDFESVKRIIKNGGDVNDVDSDGNTPLLIAVLTRQEKVVDELLKHGADPHKTRADGKGPLFGAIRVGDDKLAQMLLKRGVFVDAPISVNHNGVEVGGCTLLYAAALQGQLPQCRLLLDAGAQLEANNDIGYTPLMASIEGDHEDVIDLLLKRGANVNPTFQSTMQINGLGGSTPLYTATRKENLSIIKKLLKHGADANRPAPNSWSPLKSAAQQGSFEVVKTLLEAGADPNIADDTNYTPLMNAVSGQHESIVKILLKFKADPNVQSGENPEDDDWESGRCALMDAAHSGNVAIARMLLESGANPNLLNSKGRTALHSAVFSTRTDMLTLLLQSGANPNIFGSAQEQISALDLALRRWASADKDEGARGESDVLELLLKKGMPSNRGSLNETALDLVAEGHLDVVSLLDKHGFSVDANYSTNGASPLFLTAAIGDDRLQAAELLLQIGADVNYKNPAGLSVLSLATRNGATRLAELLLKAGANVMDRNGVNSLAYDLAVLYDHDELIDLLILRMNEVGPAIDRQAGDGTTALMRATMEADVKAVEDLLAAGADASRRNRRGESPLSYAVTHDLNAVVQTLRKAGVERLPGDTVVSSESLVYAASQGAVGTLLELLDSGVPINQSNANANGDSAFTAAAAHPGMVAVLAKLGADLSHRNSDGKTAYMIAAASNRTRMMQVLEEIGSPMDQPGELDGLAQVQAMLNALRGQEADDANEGEGEDLLMACLTGDAITVSRKIASGVEVNYVNAEGRTALAMAIQGLLQNESGRRRERNFEQILDQLLRKGANPRVGEFPYLVFAAMGKRLHLVNALIRAGASIDRSIDEGQTALFMSLLAPDTGKPADDRCALALLKAGADSSLRHESGVMPVHLAAGSNYLGALQALLDHRPQDVDAKTNIGITPLMMAATEGHAEAVQLLLKFGADRALKDDEGLTAKEIAIKNGNENLVPLLN